MKKRPLRASTRLQTLLLGAGVAVLLSTAPWAQAQTIYRVVGPDGRVTFSDKPPSNLSTTASTVAAKSSGPGTPGTVALPFELRQVVGKYPVTLYSANNCGPCSNGRTFLTQRGIPFTEKTINTPEDSDALQRISGANSLPFLTIGAQQLKGFSDAEWTQFLNAAEYPATSQLPAGYHNPAAAPLVVLQKPTPPAKREEAPAARAPTPPDNASNPAGIRF